MIYIYVLKLETNRYYVGKTMNPIFRMQDHFDSGGSAWTIKYRPINIHELIPDCDDFDEDKHTLRYMQKYGIDYVRGGSFCNIILSEENRKTIEKMLTSVSGKCFKCGQLGHYANTCFDTGGQKMKAPKINIGLIVDIKDVRILDL